MSDDGRQIQYSQSNYSSTTLFSRLDHLDLMMKSLEGKRNYTKLVSNGSALKEKQCMPFDFALKEACFKGSVLDRVASLENRLFQLCLDMEARSFSMNSSAQTSGESSASSQGSRGGSYSSYPTFKITNHGQRGASQLHFANGLEIEEISEKLHEEKNSASNGRKSGKKRTKDEKPSQDVKKGIRFKWSHLKILGC